MTPCRKAWCPSSYIRCFRGENVRAALRRAGRLLRRGRLFGDVLVDVELTVAGLERVLAVARLRRGFAMIGCAAVGDARCAAIEHHGAAAVTVGQHVDPGVGNLRAFEVEGDDVGAAITLAENEGVAQSGSC